MDASIERFKITSLIFTFALDAGGLGTLLGNGRFPLAGFVDNNPLELATITDVGGGVREVFVPFAVQVLHILEVDELELDEICQDLRPEETIATELWYHQNRQFNRADHSTRWADLRRRNGLLRLCFAPCI